MVRTVEIQGAAAAPAVEKPAEQGVVRIDAGARPADLQVRIAARSTLDRRMFRCRVQTPHLPDFAPGREEDWDVPELVDTLVGKYMAAFTKSGSTPLERRIALLGAGRQLFEVTPSLFREALFRLLDEGKPLETIAIVSAEPFLPWEILLVRARRRRQLGRVCFLRRSLGGADAWEVKRFSLLKTNLPSQGPVESSFVFAAPAWRPDLE